MNSISRLSYFLLFIIIILPSFLCAQDTLQIPKDIAAETNDSIKMMQLFKLGNKEPQTRRTEQLFWYHAALDIAKKKNYPQKYFLINSNIGLNLIFQGKYNHAKEVFLENLAFQKERALKIEKKNISKNYNNLGHCYYKLKDYPNALETHFKALEIREAINDPKLSSSYNNIGLIYMDLEQHKKAIEYFEKSLTLKRKNKDNQGIINSLNNLGIVHKNIRNNKKAKKYYGESLTLAKEIGDLEKMANALNNLGQVAFWEDDYTLAVKYHEEVFGIRQQLGNLSTLVISLIDLTQMHLEAHQLPEALERLHSIRDLVENNEDVHLDLQDFYSLYSSYYTLVGDSEQSSAYFLKYKAIKDSLDLKKNAMVLADIETKYETKKKEQEIKLLKQENIIASLELERIQTQRKWIFSILVFMFVIIGILFWLYRYRSKTNQELETLNATKDKLFTIIGHDLKNPLIGFRSITQSLSSNLDTMDKHSILYFIQKLEKSSNQLYLLIQNLLQWAINQSGQLSNNPQHFALEQLVTDVFNLFKINAEREEITLINDIPTGSMVYADLKITQTILRNLIDNAIKFTPKGGEVCVQATKIGKTVEISVKDTGQGMSKEEQGQLFQNTASTINNDVPQKGTGIGLLLCKELAERLNSSIKVNSKKGEGTIFSFSLQQTKNA